MRGWSQGDLAQRLEVSRPSVNAIETGKFDSSLPLAFKLAVLFGLRIEEVFEEEAGTGSVGTRPGRKNKDAARVGHRQQMHADEICPECERVTTAFTAATIQAECSRLHSPQYSHHSGPRICVCR